jgi:hypothetical protein
MTKRSLIVRTVLSGLFSYLGVVLLGLTPGGVETFRNSGVYLAGILFGVLVLSPGVLAGPGQPGRRAAAVGLSTLIYYGAVKLAMYLAMGPRIQEMISCGLAGLLGALAVAAVVALVLRRRVPAARLAEAAAAGALTGALFGVNGTFHVPNALEFAFLIAGYVAWQTAVGVILLRDGAAA